MKGENRINPETCTRCGSCMEVCPAECIGRTDDGKYIYRPETSGFCISCGQCMSVCPSRSVYVSNLDYERDFFNITGKSMEQEEFYKLINSRRSIRNYKNTAVPHEILDKLVEAISYAPPSIPPIKISVVVVEGREKIEEALAMMIGLYDKMLKAFNTPIGRFIIRMSVPGSKFSLLKEHVVPLMKIRMPGLKSGRKDTITRGAPAMILLHADNKAGNIETDGAIAVTYAMLAAHSLGLGSCVLDIVKQAVGRSPELRKKFGIPVQNEVVGAIVVGYAKYIYRRSIRRKPAGVIWI